MNRRLTTLACCLVATATLSAQVPVVKQDFNADGKSDVLLFNKTSTAAYELQVFNASVQLEGYVHTPTLLNWTIAATGVNTLTGVSDTFWQNKVTGDVYKMAMAGVGFDAAKSKMVYNDLNADWQLIMAADFDKDGVPDLLFRNVQTGVVWLQPLAADGTLKTGHVLYTEPNLAWKPVATAAAASVLTGGTTTNNLVWFNSATGSVYMMVIKADGTVDAAASKVIYTASSTAWQLVAADDYNRDGNADLLFWNKTTGDVHVVALSSTFAVLSGTTIHNADPAVWEIAGTGDYNGDGYTDILWRNITATAGTTGNLYAQFINVDLATGKPMVNTTDSTTIYIPFTTPLSWRPVSLTSVSIDAPTVVQANPAVANTSVEGKMFSLVNPTVIKPGNMPVLYVTKGDPLTLAARVQGPVSDTGVTWSAYKADNSASASTFADPAVGTFLWNPSSLTVTDFIVKATSNAAPSLVSARKVVVVAAPPTPTLTASASTAKLGDSVTLTYAWTAATGVTAALLDDQGSSPIPLAASGTVVVTPGATTNYSVKTTNLATKTATSALVPVTVTGTIIPLDCTVTINSPNASAVTAGSVYTASVPAETDPNVVTKWSITNGAIIGATNGSMVTFVATSSDATLVTVTVNKTNAVSSQANTGFSTRTTTLAPVAPTAITVVNDLGAPQGTYLTAGKAAQIATASGGTGTTWEWTVTNATIQSGNGTNSISFTPTATGTVNISVKSLNAALAKSAAFAVSRTALPLADATVTTTSFEGVTGPYATTGIAGNIASVPNAGTGATYTWTVTGGTADGGITNTRSILFTPAAGSGGTTTLSCTVTNAAGNSVTTPLPGRVVRTCGLPAAPTGYTYTGVHKTAGIPDFMTLGAPYVYAATATGGSATGGVNGYDAFTYDWSASVNTTVKSGAATAAITFGANATTPSPVTDAATQYNILKAKVVNAAGAVSTAFTGTSITVVAVPAIQGFTLNKSAITISEAITATMAFTGGNGTLIDSAGSLPSASYPAGATTGTWTPAANADANALGATRTLTLRVTNAASDVVELSRSIDVAALPDPVLNVALGGGVYGGEIKELGTSFKLTPVYTSYAAPATNAGFAGQTAVITPGSISNPATGSANFVTPAAGTTVYNLNVTSRNGLTVVASTGAAGTIYSPVVSAAAISATTPATGFTIGLGETVTLSGSLVSGAVNKDIVWTLVPGAGLGTAFLSASQTATAVYPTLLGTGLGANKLVATAYADANWSYSASFTVATTAITVPVYNAPSDHVTAVTPASGGVVSGAYNTAKVYSIVAGGTGTATVTNAATGQITPTVAGTVFVKVTATATGVSQQVTLTFP
jgi:hypothetical protein